MILKPPSLGGGDNDSSVIFCSKQYRVDGACTIPSTGAKSSPFKVIGPHIQSVVLHSALVHIGLFNPVYAIQPAKYCTVNCFGASI